MPTRQVVDLGNGNVKKIVPTFEGLQNKKFPELGEIHIWDEEVHNRIYELLEDTSNLCKSAVVQQYNEYILSREAYAFNINVFAPVNFVSFDERNLPILGFPKFTPLVSSKDFYKYSEEESLILLGIAAEKHDVDFEKIRDFIREIKQTCIDFDLREDDILSNLSNIGYHKDYGFRVIDFGLTENDFNDYSLVF